MQIKYNILKPAQVAQQVFPFSALTQGWNNYLTFSQNKRICRKRLDIYRG
jgi:hypothetical protein